MNAALDAWRALSHEEQVARMAERSGLAPFPSRGTDGGRLRVGQWAPLLFEAGAEAWMLTLARSLADRVSWRGLAVASPQSIDPAMSGRFRPFLPVAAGRDACRALAADCDVVVSWAMPDVPGLLAGLQAPPKVVSVCHSPVDSEWGMASYRDPAGIDAYVAVSELALGPICESRRAGARVIWNAVDEPRMVWTRGRAEMRRSWGVPAGAKVAGYMGRLAPEKDPHAMLRLAASLPENWHVAIVGDGLMRPRLDREKWDRGLTRVHFLGPDNRAGDVLHALDTLIVPSEYESFGLTLAEGLWLGTPVVSTPVGIARLCPDLTREVPVGADGPTLAAAVLADDSDRAGTIARVARGIRFASDRLSMDRFAREWDGFLHGLAVPRAAKLARVAACPDRGPELPVSDPAYASGCCSGSTMHECRANKGRIPGKPVLRECLECCGSSRLSQ